MAFYGGPQGATTISPVAQELYTKIGKLEVADGSTGFAAFGIPKDAVIGGIYTLCTGANATQTINVGFTNGGTDLLKRFRTKLHWLCRWWSTTGTAVGTKLGC